MNSYWMMNGSRKNGWKNVKSEAFVSHGTEKYETEEDTARWSKNVSPDIEARLLELDNIHVFLFHLFFHPLLRGLPFVYFTLSPSVLGQSHNLYLTIFPVVRSLLVYFRLLHHFYSISPQNWCILLVLIVLTDLVKSWLLTHRWCSMSVQCLFWHWEFIEIFAMTGNILREISVVCTN